MNMLSSRIATVAASLCLVVAMATNALAQACDCVQSTLMGTQVGTLLNNNYSGPVMKTVTNGIELPNAGPTLGAAGNAPRWNINFGSNTIRIDFLQQVATYGAGSKFTFSSLNPVAPPACPGTPVVAGISVVTNKAGAPYVTAGATFTPNSVMVPFAGTSNVNWNPGEYILITLKFACQAVATPPPSTFDPCCPPWNSSVLQNAMHYSGSGGISSPYTLLFQPTATMTSQLQAYLNYLNSLNPAITSISVVFTLLDGGTGTSYGGPNTPVAVSPNPGVATWYQGNTNFQGFFPANAMAVNHWYRISSVISLNAPQHFFSDKCANSYIDVRLQVLPSARTLQMRFPDGHVLERKIVNNRVQ